MSNELFRADHLIDPSAARVYLVGGAVRDDCLGLPISERDWVVVGAVPDLLLSAGYRLVGGHFPVFLHPKTNEEYALARTERKIGPGHTGFEAYSAPDVTLEDDLKRRDLTINAMARDADGRLIDPYGGLSDLKAGVLRHVSAAFEEDPLRVLRVARFAARFPNFTVDPATSVLMRKMVERGDLLTLSNERIWQELSRALYLSGCARFFEVLDAVGALALLFPFVSQHAVASLSHVVSEDSDIASLVRFVLAFREIKPKSINELCATYRIPKLYKELLELVVLHHHTYSSVMQLGASGLLDLLHALDALRRPARLDSFWAVCTILYPCVGSAVVLRLHDALQLARSVSLPEQEMKLSGPERRDYLDRARVRVISEYLGG